MYVYNILKLSQKKPKISKNRNEEGIYIYFNLCIEPQFPDVLFYTAPSDLNIL